MINSGNLHATMNNQRSDQARLKSYNNVSGITITNQARLKSYNNVSGITITNQARLKSYNNVSGIAAGALPTTGGTMTGPLDITGMSPVFGPYSTTPWALVNVGNSTFQGLISNRLNGTASCTEVIVGDSNATGADIPAWAGGNSVYNWPRRCYERERAFYNNSSFAWEFKYHPGLNNSFAIYTTTWTPSVKTQKYVQRMVNLSHGGYSMTNYTSLAPFANVSTSWAPLFLTVMLGDDSSYTTQQQLAEWGVFQRKILASYPGTVFNVVNDNGLNSDADKQAASLINGGFVDFNSVLRLWDMRGKHMYFPTLFYHPDAQAADLLGYLYAKECLPGAPPVSPAPMDNAYSDTFYNTTLVLGAGNNVSAPLTYPQNGTTDQKNVVLSNMTTFIIQTDGRYNIQCNVQWEPSTGGTYRATGDYVNGVLMFLGKENFNSTNNVTQFFNDNQLLHAGDRLSLKGMQDSGGSVTVSKPTIYITRMGNI